MKKTFRIINILAVVLTVSLVSFTFLTKYTSGKKIYKQVYNFANCTESIILQSDLASASEITKIKASSVLTSEQKLYFDLLGDTLVVVSNYYSFLSIQLSQETARKSMVNSIETNIENLEEERRNLLLDIDEYLTKLDGNTYGSIETSVDYLMKKTTFFISNFASIGIRLNNLTSFTDSRKVEYNLINLHLKAIVSLKANYKDLNFSNQAINVVEDLNDRIIMNNNNFVLGKQGIYSPIATNFNHYLEICNINELVTNYVNYSNLDINPNTEKNNSKLAFYYFYKLTEVA